MTPAVTILAQVDFVETHPPNAPRYSRSVTTPFSSCFRSLDGNTLNYFILSFVPSHHPTILVTFHQHSVRRIPLAFGGTSSYTFTRTRYSLSSSLFFRVESVVLLFSGGLSSSLFLSLSLVRFPLSRLLLCQIIPK